MEFSKMSNEELKSLKAELEKNYDNFKQLGLKLDMSRGKPNKAQLDLSNPILDIVNSSSDMSASDGTETRNYGVLTGIPECRKLMADLMGVNSENVIVCGVASLTIMYDYIAQCMIFGCGDEPWCKQDKIKFLCPCPGYDRHFGILNHFGIEMINIKMNDDGPDMDSIEEYVKDSSVKGVFVVPKYSNPDGITFSDEVVRRFAALKPAAKDFRVIWDNAYIVHDINDTPDELLNIFDAAREYGSEDMFIEVCSTSKISFAGGGISAVAASKNNIEAIKNKMTIQIITNDKINQLRHARYFKNIDGIKAHMKKHAVFLRPKFETVINGFTQAFDGTGIAHWKNPNGGYFVSLYVLPGCAKRVGELCKQAGLTLTTVGATYPYGIDPDDSNIRIAPTFPDVDELKKAVDLLCICVKLAAVEKLLKE
ncbi:MAG: aminotransferase class I/II-fold pyridoxal phosphate-dependent enzyme [Ruminococcus sp.]|nr:aminotransferase class I/II-fold pyridoxal phosphate-dependent enzyme [Candidatus Copronaster equi]